MPDAHDFSVVEARIAQMSDGDLIEALDHPAEYQPWALELIAAEHPDRAKALRRAGRLAFFLLAIILVRGGLALWRFLR